MLVAGAARLVPAGAGPAALDVPVRTVAASAPAEGPAAATAVPDTAATPAPTPEPEPTPAPTEPPPSAAAAPPPIVATPYRSGGRSYAALRVPVGLTLDAPIAGRVEVRLYQFIDGEIRIGANVPSLPYFPYVVVRAPDRVLTLRPGALGVDSEVLVRDGATVSAGTPLVRVTGTGASSWRTFYDRTMAAQVLASFTTAVGVDLDAVALFVRN
jgi:hypothetical protein